MMKVEVLVSNWCGKCRQAKKILEEYPVEWVLYNSPAGIKLLNQFKIEKIPAFVINKESMTYSILEVRDLFNNAKEKEDV